MKPEEIKALRARHGLTQAQLARRVKVNAHIISRWERGASSPDIHSAERLRAVVRRLEREKVEPLPEHEHEKAMGRQP